MSQICPNRQLLSAVVPKHARRERGVALVMTIFGLLLLTAITAAMLYSSNSETMISVNYRDKQVASYAAFSALQEARNRIHPISGDLALSNYAPTNTPDAGGYVLYILNPRPGEVIQPWNPANQYFDQELCQEGMLGVARGQAGVACNGVGAIPGGGCSNVTGGAVAGWCAFYDNSASATAWNLPGKLDYKWVRISMKEDWNTPVWLPDAITASGKQACWDGNYQNQRPAGYTTNCMPTSGNSVIGINLVSAGAGYSSPPSVTISGGGGTGAAATAQIGPSGGGAISGATISPAGAGYSKPPAVTFSGVTDGSGATLKALINGAAITNVSLSGSNTNYCYTNSSSPTVNFSTVDPTDTLTGATGTVNMANSGCVAVVTPSGTCNNNKNSTIAIGPSAPLGGGSGFAGNVVFDSSGSVSTIIITSVGSGYTTGSHKITVGNGNSCQITPTFTVGQTVQGITLSNGGSYMNTPTAALSGTPAAPQTPVLPTVTANWPGVNSPVTGIQILNGGSGYLQPNYALKICSSTGNCSAGGLATTGAVNIITAINLTSGGQNYTSNPTVTISGGGGGGASATATIGAGANNTSMGPVYLLTALAETRTGAKSMAQMEVGVRPPFMFNIGGPLTLGGPLGLTGPTPTFPNSNNFIISGNDANTCAQTPTNKPAIGVYDSQSQQDVINSLGKPQNYIGAGGTPSIEDVYTQIGGASLTPIALESFIQSLEQYVTSPTQTGNVTSLPATTTSSVTAVNGNLTLSGNPNGSGILIITGTLTFSGNFTWNGLVLVVGQGQVVHNGGGNGIINGAMYIAQTRDAAGNLLGSLGSPQFVWNGGGGNTIQYDHCKADGLLQKYAGQPSPLPLQVLSSRALNF